MATSMKSQWLIIFHLTLFGSHGSSTWLSSVIRDDQEDQAEEIAVEAHDESHDAIIAEAGASQIKYKHKFEIQIL